MKSLEASRIPVWFEPVALVLLSLATIGTAWCSFQAAAWGGAAQLAMNQSAAASRDAVSDQLQSSQLAVLDVLLFSQYINASATSNAAHADFYANRFRNEARIAFDAWLDTDPFANPNAPPHPFVTNLYQPRLLESAREAEAQSLVLWQKAGDAGRISRSYVLVTVLLASALFCGGTATRFEALWIRRSVLALGLVAAAVAAGKLLSLPTQL